MQPMPRRKKETQCNSNAAILEEIDKHKFDSLSHVVVSMDTRKITVANPDMSSKINVKQRLLLGTLKHYFEQDEKYDKLEMVIGKDCVVSLRVLDWLTTNYAKHENVMLHQANPFNLHAEYKACLKAYQKKSFDPFARRERIIFSVKGKRSITTPGQLNFFRWAIENGVLEYAIDNYSEIEGHMLKHSRNKLMKSSKKVGLVKHYIKTNVKL